MATDRQPEILCVDDSRQNLKLLGALLQPEGYAVRFASGGQEALEEISKKLPDLMLLDIMMPEISGFDVLKAVREDENSRALPVVMLTALVDTESRVQALEAGCDDFISKPFDKVELLARVRSLLRISYYRSRLDERDKLAAVTEAINDGVLILDGELRIKSFNKSAAVQLSLKGCAGLTLSEALGEKYRFSLPEEKALSLDGAGVMFDIIREETGSTRPLYLEASKTVLRDPEEKVASVVMTLRDVTEARREETLKHNFMGLISHKLRTPLTVLAGNIELLDSELDGPLNKNQRIRLKAISQSSRLLQQLVEKLIRFTSLCGMAEEGDARQFSIKDEITAAARETAKRPAGRKVRLRISCPEGLKADMNQACFRQVMLSLLDNAVKFNDKETASIEVSASEENGGLAVMVKDNGPGIPGEELRRIFEKFYQIEKYFSGQVEGAGLGLPLARKIAEQYGGCVTAESELGKGAAFIFRIPGRRD